MKLNAFKYSQFAFYTILKKKSSIILPIFTLVSSLIIGLILKFVVNNKYVELLSFLYVFILITLTVVFSCIKALNIFKDLEQEGLEIISLSKPLTRESLIIGKLLCLTFFGLIWSLTLLISGFLSLYATYSFLYLFLTSLLLGFVGLITYLLFSLFTVLLSYKLAQKISMIIPFVLFVPLSLIGMILSINVKSNVDQASFYINKEYKNHHSGNEVNVEPYYLNNHKDELFLIPNGVNNKEFSVEQVKYLEDVVNYSNSSSNIWQIYSWLSIPYQLVDVFNFKNKNLFASLSDKSNSNLDKYIYYNNLDDISYKYKLDKKPNLKKYKTNANNTYKYIVPGILKSHSIHSQKNDNTSGHEEIVDFDVIYAADGADNKDKEFLEDKNQLHTDNKTNLVGRLRWIYVYEALSDPVFNQIAKEFVTSFNKQHFTKDFNKEFDKLVKQNNTKEIDNKLKELNKKLMTYLSEYLNNKESKIYSYNNNNITIFDQYAIKRHNKLQSQNERILYFAISFLNYIYFNYPDSLIYQAMLKNPDNDSYGDYQVKLDINSYKYNIGGYSSYQTQYEKKDKETNTVLRFSLTKSNNNYLFESTNELFSISRSKRVVNKNVLFLLWIIVIGVELLAVFELYRKKDYK
ncbi:ABC transporter permease family protein [Mycoplasma mycoides]|uniref:ABC transporter permease n=1 Tax=Mycoplasma mycoides TaxID=2102 RepID=UPI00223F834E|nr:ABC transporter permease [Mycoplasma mycoides]QVK05970.1 ABC transporter permease [Mycoplasma mycoides subsp. capri]QVK08484.1 ABC transporter permease [Mycoplasma mycoides subsp. capri]